MLCSLYFGHTARFLPGKAVENLSVSKCCGRALGLGEPEAEQNRLRVVCQPLVAMLFHVAVSHGFQGQEAFKGSLAKLPPPPTHQNLSHKTVRPMSRQVNTIFPMPPNILLGMRLTLSWGRTAPCMTLRGFVLHPAG